ncbi:hypothetical protein D3C85_666650 [compost metagenome]
MARLSAVIIKGNPKYLNTPLAHQYYAEIETYLKQLGVNEITYDSGEPMTCPRLDADIYIAHSRGVDRERCMKDPKKPFVKLGDPEGVIHPTDLKWHNEVFKFTPGGNITPPDEHFLFFKEQREAVRHAVEAACKRNPVFVSPKSFRW